jgi:hypothetical protein
MGCQRGHRVDHCHLGTGLRYGAISTKIARDREIGQPQEVRAQHRLQATAASLLLVRIWLARSTIVGKMFGIPMLLRLSHSVGRFHLNWSGAQAKGG